jgi:short-subunit dehydrogenase
MDTLRGDAATVPTLPNGAARPRALVTGASSGIGRCLVDELVARGYDVVAVADGPSVREMAQEQGSSVTPVQVDLATSEGVAELLVRLREQPTVRFAAFNAGVARGGAFLRTGLADHLRLVDLNVRSVVHLAHEVLADMVDGRGGHVLFLSSIAAVAPGPYQATYAASKAFVHSFAEGVRHELRGSEVTVTSVQPGPTDTNIFARGGMLATRIAQGPKDDPGEVAREAIEAALAGRGRVVTGSWANLAAAMAGRVLPEWVTTRASAHAARPGRPRRR